MQIPALTSVTVEVLVDNFFDVFEPSKPGVVERVLPGRLVIFGLETPAKEGLEVG